MAVTISLSQSFANATVRDAYLLDYSKIHMLDIYSDTVLDGQGNVVTLGTIVQQSKVLPAIEKHIFAQGKEDVINYRAGMAGKTATATAKAAAKAELNGV